MRSSAPKQLFAYLERYDPAIRELALDLRELILAELSPPHEYILDANYAVAMHYGPTERVIKDGVCYIAVYRRGVNLGFLHGAQMDDPARLLEGNGKSMRHISIKSPADLARPEITTYLHRAWNQFVPDSSEARALVSIAKAAKKKAAKKKVKGKPRSRPRSRRDR